MPKYTFEDWLDDFEPILGLEFAGCAPADFPITVQPQLLNGETIEQLARL